MTNDLKSVAGKTLDLSGHCSLLVVGAGPAGIAAAIEAAELGASVTLIDENPVAFESMGESVPQFYGLRMSGAVRNRNAMMEQMLEASPALATAFELGVDVRLGTACWGLFLNSSNMRWMEKPVAGLVDDESGSLLVSFDQVIVATGRRDMGLAFPGWEQSGVMGASAAVTLARRYRALDARRAVIIGTTAEAMLAAMDLSRAGVEVICLVEQADRSVAPPEILSLLKDSGIPVKSGETVLGTIFGRDGVKGIRLRDSDIACDLVVLAVGTVPVIDLLASAGCATSFIAERGGFVPRLDETLATSFPNVRAIGDCAGIWAGKSADGTIAEAEGRLAAQRAVLDLGLDVAESVERPAPAPPAVYDIGSYRKDWIRSCVLGAETDPHVCQCEDVTAREILEVRPPRYLDWQASDNRLRDLPTLLGADPPDPDQIKRLTRAGMGPCQGRRCREQVQALLAVQADLPLQAIGLASYRAPVRPMPLKTAAPVSEDSTIAAQWDSWFGVPRQWTPFWEVEETYTVASLAVEKPHVSE